MTLQCHMRFFTLLQAVLQFSHRSANKRQNTRSKKTGHVKTRQFSHACICLHHMLTTVLLLFDNLWGNSLFATKPDFPILVFRVLNKTSISNVFSVSHSTFLCPSYRRRLGSPGVRENLVWSFTQGVTQFRVKLGFEIFFFFLRLRLFVMLSDLEVTCIYEGIMM